MRDRREYVFAQCVSTHVTLPRGFRPQNHRLPSVAPRSEPSSRTFLIGEQPNAWDLLQPRAKVSRPLVYIISHVLSRITTGADYTFVPLSKQDTSVLWRQFDSAIFISLI